MTTKTKGFSRRVLLTGVTAAAASTVVGGVAPLLAADEISVGATLPLTGALAAAGQQQQNALQMAQSEINAAGGIAGRPLNIVFEDAQASNSSAVTAFIALMRRVNPSFMFLSSYTTQNLAVEQSLARARIPAVYGGGGVSVADTGNKWMFRIRPEDSIQANAMVEFASKDLKTQRPGFIYLQNEFGQGVTEAATKLFATAGVSAVASESFRAGDSDFAAQILNLKNKSVDVLILVAYPREGALILKQCHQLGLAASILTSSGVMLPSAIDLMEPNELSKVYGIVDVLLAVDRDPKVTGYVETYHRKFNIRPDAFGVCYYNAAFMLKQAVEAVGLDAEKLRTYLAAVKDFRGVGQTFTTDARGNMMHTQDIVRFEPGTNTQVYVRTVTA